MAGLFPKCSIARVAATNRYQPAPAAIVSQGIIFALNHRW